MTRFVDVPAMAKLIQAIEVDEFIAELSDVIEANFVRWEEFDKAARFGAHNDEGVIELMPTANAERYGFKYVNGHPENIKHDLFSVMGPTCIRHFIDTKSTTGHWLQNFLRIFLKCLLDGASPKETQTICAYALPIRGRCV